MVYCSHDVPPGSGKYVLYWMQQSCRGHYNHALELALLVVFVLTDNYPEYSDGNSTGWTGFLCYCFLPVLHLFIKPLYSARIILLVSDIIYMGRLIRLNGWTGLPGMREVTLVISGLARLNRRARGDRFSEEKT